MGIGAWLGVADAAEKFYKVYEYFNDWNRIDSYDPNAEVIYKDGQYFKVQYDIDPYNQEETVRRLVELSYDEYQLQYQYDEEQKNRKPEEMMKNFLQELENRKGEIGKAQQEVSIQFGSVAQQPSFSFIDKTKILKNQAEEMAAALRNKINDLTATNYEGGMGDTVDETANMRKQSEQIAAAGIDTAQLDQQISQYESIAKDKIVETWRKSWTQLKTDTRATQAEIAGDTAAFADVQYAAAISRLDEERVVREKAVMQDKNDLVAKQAVETWYTAQVDLEQQKRDAKYTENQLSRYRSNVEHNKLLLDLENKTQAEVDLLNEQELKSEIYYLDEKLKDAGLAGDKRLAMEKEKSSAIKALNEIASRDMTAALDLHMQELQKRSIDWKSVYDGAFSSIDSSVQGHLNQMIIGTESFSNGMVGIFNTMSMEIRKIWIKMWYEQEIMKPLQNWWSGILGGIKGIGSGDGIISNLLTGGMWGNGLRWNNPHGDFNFDSGFGIDYSNPGSGFNFNSDLGINYKYRANGGGMPSNGFCRIDESEKEGSRLQPLSMNASHYEFGAMNGTPLPKTTNIMVNLINQTGTQAKAEATSKFDDLGNMIIQVIVDAIPQNKGGLQDLIVATGRGR